MQKTHHEQRAWEDLCSKLPGDVTSEPECPEGGQK
jgi:hypothetical protein